MKSIVINLTEYLKLILVLKKYNINFDYYLGTRGRVLIKMKLEDAKRLGF